MSRDLCPGLENVPLSMEEFLGNGEEDSSPLTRKVDELVKTKFRPVEELLDEVMDYENPDIVARMKKELGLIEEEANLLFDDTKRFLYLTAMYPGTWSPPKKVDKGWHEFLMFTKDYTEFCQRFFGRFIHHEPKRLNDPSTGGSQTRNAILAARELFGDLSSNWTLDEKYISGQTLSGVDEDPCSGDGGGTSDGCSACK